MTHTAPWLASIPKHQTRLDNLAGLGRSRLLVDRTGRLRHDWVELAGPGAPTLDLLLAEGKLTPGGPAKFIGIDTSPTVLESARLVYGPEAPALWVHDHLVGALRSARDVFPNAGVLVFDSLNAARGQDIEATLDVLFQFATQRHADHGEFYLVLNVSMMMVGEGGKAYKAGVARRLGRPIPETAWTTYRSSPRSNPMLLTRIRFGF